MTVDSAHNAMRSPPRHDRSVARPARERLLQQRKTRLDQLAEIERAAAECGGDELTVAQLTALRPALEEIDAALVRLDHGAYGVCQHCWTPIAAERLEILPHARFCVRCQRRLR
jgi:RNA polymerase-binding transcription factor